MDLVHSYGLWTDVNRLAGDIARRRRLPHLLAPCGMLAPGAMRHHGWKKVPVRFWFQDRALREAQCLHAKSQQEYEDLRRFGLRNPVAIIANPVGPGPRDNGLRDNGTTGKEQRAEVGGQKSVVSGPWSVVPWSVVHGSRTVLFLGRLHPVKGLPRLLQAWAELQKSAVRPPSSRSPVVSGQWSGSPSSCNWQLVLAGPDEGGYRREVESLVSELGCGDSVIFTGELDDNQKWAALAAADLFVMPSDFENFGNAIVEAMLSGLPVVTTTGTPWKELPVQGAGWCVEPTVEALNAALREALAMPEEKRQAMGRRAAEFAKRFGPEQVAADLIQVYQWLLGRGERPSCVVL
jgi:glycosyltransferase involved in cell wall biosynthesis